VLRVNIAICVYGVCVYGVCVRVCACVCVRVCVRVCVYVCVRVRVRVCVRQLAGMQTAAVRLTHNGRRIAGVRSQTQEISGVGQQVVQVPGRQRYSRINNLRSNVLALGTPCKSGSFGVNSRCNKHDERVGHPRSKELNVW